MRVGHGFDIHPLVEARKLIIAGVEVPSPVGAKGHSDADVVLHALADAYLGALGLGDIGEWFPDTDARWKDADSARLLAMVLEEVGRRGWRTENIDVAVYLEMPKLGGLKALMRRRLAALCGLDADAVGMKARTFEGFGAVGQGQAVAASAVVLITRAV